MTDDHATLFSLASVSGANPKFGLLSLLRLLEPAFCNTCMTLPSGILLLLSWFLPPIKGLGGRAKEVLRVRW